MTLVGVQPRGPLVGLMACDPQGVIGIKGGMAWYEPDETEHFRTTVQGHTLLMGRVTYEDTPPATLATCRCVVLTRGERPSMVPLPPHVAFVSTAEELVTHPFLTPHGPNYVIGGAQVMHLMLDNQWLSQWVLTVLKTPYKGDTHLELSRVATWPRDILYKHPRFKIFRLSRPF